MLNHVMPQAQQGTSLDWRCHLEGAQKVITLRGGIRALAGSRGLKPSLLCLVLYVPDAQAFCALDPIEANLT